MKALPLRCILVIITRPGGNGKQYLSMALIPARSQRARRAGGTASARKIDRQQRKQGPRSYERGPSVFDTLRGPFPA